MAPLRFAFVSPLPPARSGVADYAARLLGPLSERLDLEVFADQPVVDCPEVTARLPVFHARRFRDRLYGLDGVLYEMGNSSAHQGVERLLLDVPGIVHLHDVNLHHFHLDSHARRGRVREYVRRMTIEHGRDGAAFADAVRANLGGSLGYFMLPLGERILARSVGVVVHSQWARNVLRRRHRSLPVLRVPPPCSYPVHPPDPNAFRQRFGLPSEAFVVGVLGAVTPAKRIDRVLEALRDVLDVTPGIRLAVVGRVSEECRLDERVRELGLGSRVLTTGWVDEETYWNAVAAVDVAVNLRHPTAGESSAPAMQAMALGQPVIVSALRQFLELPDEACVKVPLGDKEVPVLAAALRELARDAARRSRMGKAALEFSRQQAAPERVARRIAAFATVLAPRTRRRFRAMVAA